jgi:preprotein translocase subunit SecY
MNTFLSSVKNIWREKELRNKILFVLAMFVVFRFVSAIPMVGVDTARLAAFFETNQYFSLLNLFSGGGLSNLSLAMLGVGPYITASIIMQLLTMLSPKLKSMYQDEGAIGRSRFAQYSRLIAVPLAIIQSFALLALLERQNIIIFDSIFLKSVAIASAVAGTMFLMWIGELISVHGIGNGVSLMIFAGIVSSIPSSVSQFLVTATLADLPLYLLFFLLGISVVAGVVYITEAERPVPVTYARKNATGSATYGTVATYLPLRLNQAGVIPVIFAISIMLFPQLVGNFMVTSANSTVKAIAESLIRFSQGTSIVYMVVYFVLVFAFTYFYTIISFSPDKMAENLQKSGAFIPGVRPGVATEEYVSNILGRITFFGATFLALIAILPLIVRSVTGITTIAIGGTALLIVVSVVIDFIKKIRSQLSMNEY